MEGCAVWFVGLPGSGKSSIARCVVRNLKAEGLPVLYLEMDARRKDYFPIPTYSQKERKQAYEMFVEEACRYVTSGKIVIMDGSAPQRFMRDTARINIPKFAEIMVQCSVQTAMEREATRAAGKVMADLYAKALERKKTGKEVDGLGQVIGVDVPFEENPEAEFVLDNQNLSKEESCRRAMAFLDSWLNNA